MSSLPPNIAVTNISFQRDEQLIFDQLEINFQAGRWSCLLGQSGVGKTSLLRLIAGLETLQGEASSTLQADFKDQIAYMGQHISLLPWKTVLENTLLGARLRGETPDKEKAISLLQQVGLGKSLSKRPAQLSGGMKQRCVLARTLMEDRPIVLMDEPFSALDAVTRHELQALTYDLLKGRTVLLVTHDPLEALRLGGDIYVMEGRPARLTQPASLNTAAPRDLGNEEVDHYYPLLLQQLTQAERVTQ